MTATTAQTEVCESGTCALSNHLIRGDRIEFVSAEQVKLVGRHPLDEKAMPSDIVLPREYVLVHDTAGNTFDRCHMHFVRFRNTRQSVAKLTNSDHKVLKDYYGNAVKPRIVEVDVPKGPWERKAKIAFIRYRREGDLEGNYEHPFEPNVYLYVTKNPLAWQLKLPNGCVVDERGFVRP